MTDQRRGKQNLNMISLKQDSIRFSFGSTYPKIRENKSTYKLLFQEVHWGCVANLYVSRDICINTLKKITELFYYFKDFVV